MEKQIMWGCQLEGLGGHPHRLYAQMAALGQSMMKYLQVAAVAESYRGAGRPIA